MQKSNQRDYIEKAGFTIGDGVGVPLRHTDECWGLISKVREAKDKIIKSRKALSDAATPQLTELGEAKSEMHRAIGAMTKAKARIKAAKEALVGTAGKQVSDLSAAKSEMSSTSEALKKAQKVCGKCNVATAVKA